MIKAKRVAHGCVATLFYFAQILNSNPERHPFIRCRTHKNEETVYVSACGSSASANFFVLSFAEAPQAFQKSILSPWKVNKRMAECFFMGKAPACFSGFAP